MADTDQSFDIDAEVEAYRKEIRPFSSMKFEPITENVSVHIESREGVLYWVDDSDGRVIVPCKLSIDFSR
jgi:hypothetical protein